MADIIQEFFVKASPDRVFDMFATPSGLDQWWTKSPTGKPSQGAGYTLFFGPDYNWHAKVTRCVPGKEFELLMTDSHEDWNGTRVGCELKPEGKSTRVRFYHTGWPHDNEH